MNNKSVVYDLSPNNKNLWMNVGLTVSDYGIEVLGSPIGSEEFIKNYVTKKYKYVA